MLFNRVSIADYANSNMNINDKSFFDETLKKGVPPVVDSPIDTLYNFRRDYPQSDGNRSRFFVVVPITTALQNQKIEEKNDYREANRADVEIFSQSSQLTTAQAKAYVKANQYKTPIDSSNHWRDAVTGRVHLFEKQWYTPAY